LGMQHASPFVWQPDCRTGVYLHQQYLFSCCFSFLFFYMIFISFFKGKHFWAVCWRADCYFSFLLLFVFLLVENVFAYSISFFKLLPIPKPWEEVRTDARHVARKRYVCGEEKVCIWQHCILLHQLMVSPSTSFPLFSNFHFGHLEARGEEPQHWLHLPEIPEAGMRTTLYVPHCMFFPIIWHSPLHLIFPFPFFHLGSLLGEGTTISGSPDLRKTRYVACQCKMNAVCCFRILNIKKY